MKRYIKIIRNNLLDFFKLDLWTYELELIIEKEKPEIIYIHEFKSLMILYKIYKKKNYLFNNIKFIYDAHEIECFRNPPKKFIIKKIIQFYEIKILKLFKAQIVATSNGHCRYYKKMLSKYNDIFLIRNLPSNIDFKKTDIDLKFKIRETYFKNSIFEDKDKLGVYIGLITINRGLEELIKLINQTPDIHLVLLGNYNNENFKEKIEKLTSDNPRIKIIPPIENHLLVNFIENADFSIVPTLPVTLSYYYSSPNKLHESKAAQLPIFAQDLPEHVLEMKVNSPNPIGVVSNFLDLTNLKTDFNIFLNNLELYKNNYDYIKSPFFNAPDQIETYKHILK